MPKHKKIVQEVKAEFVVAICETCGRESEIGHGFCARECVICKKELCYECNRVRIECCKDGRDHIDSKYMCPDHTVDEIYNSEFAAVVNEINIYELEDKDPRYKLREFGKYVWGDTSGIPCSKKSMYQMVGFIPENKD